MEIKLGKEYRDVVTGFFGVATSITKYIMGCDRVSLTPKEKDGVLMDSASFDIGCLVLVSEGCYDDINKAKEDQDETGGPEMFVSKKAY